MSLAVALRQKAQQPRTPEVNWRKLIREFGWSGSNSDFPCVGSQRQRVGQSLGIIDGGSLKSLAWAGVLPSSKGGFSRQSVVGKRARWARYGVAAAVR